MDGRTFVVMGKYQVEGLADEKLVYKTYDGSYWIKCEGKVLTKVLQKGKIFCIVPRKERKNGT